MNVWAAEGAPTAVDERGQLVPTGPIVIGSVRLAVNVSDTVHLSHCINIIILTVVQY